MKIDNTISLVSSLREVVNRAFIEEMEKEGMVGLVPSHGSVLSMLFRQEELSKGAIADGIRRDKSTVTTLINKLIKHGYVKTRKNPEDSRSILVSLTEKGKELEAGTWCISERIFETLFLDISDEERESFRTVLMKLISNMQDVYDK